MAVAVVRSLEGKGRMEEVEALLGESLSLCKTAKVGH
jgi:hypothetical protein